MLLRIVKPIAKRARGADWGQIALIAIALLQLLATTTVAMLLYAQTALMVVQEQVVAHPSAERSHNDQAAARSGT